MKYFRIIVILLWSILQGPCGDALSPRTRVQEVETLSSLNLETIGQRVRESLKKHDEAIRRIESVCDESEVNFINPDREDRLGIAVSSPVFLSLYVMHMMKALNPLGKAADLGSGFGKFCFLASLEMPVVGFEWSTPLFRVSQENREELSGLPSMENVRLVHEDFFKEDLSRYDFLYLFYNEPSGFEAGDFERKIALKMLDPTGLKMHGRLFVLGPVDELLQHEEIRIDKIRIGGSTPIAVYTRLPVRTDSRKSGTFFPFARSA